MVIRLDGSHEMAVTRGGGSLFALNQKLPLEAMSRKACGYGYCFHMGYLHKLLSGEAKISSQVIFCGAWKTNQEKRGQTVPGSLARSTFRTVRAGLENQAPVFDMGFDKFQTVRKKPVFILHREGRVRHQAVKRRAVLRHGCLNRKLEW